MCWDRHNAAAPSRLCSILRIRRHSFLYSLKSLPNEWRLPSGRRPTAWSALQCSPFYWGALDWQIAWCRLGDPEHIHTQKIITSCGWHDNTCHLCTYEQTYSVVELSPPPKKSFVGGESLAGAAEEGPGNAHWTGAATVHVHLWGGGGQGLETRRISVPLCVSFLVSLRCLACVNVAAPRAVTQILLCRVTGSIPLAKCCSCIFYSFFYTIIKSTLISVKIGCIPRVSENKID